VAYKRFPRLERFNLGKRSVYELLEREYGVRVVRARQSLEAVVASEFEAKWLRIPIGAPLILEQRVSLDDRNLPVEVGRDLYRGDRFRFVTADAPRAPDPQ
jgi:GntR family transcriptional regulator